MPYLRCPSCGLLAHMTTDGSAEITCPRCRALQQEVELLPVEQSLRLVDNPPDEEHEQAS